MWAVFARRGPRNVRAHRSANAGARLGDVPLLSAEFERHFRRLQGRRNHCFGLVTNFNSQLYVKFEPSDTAMLLSRFSASLHLSSQHDHLFDDARGREREPLVLSLRKPSAQHHVGASQRHDDSWQRREVLSTGECMLLLSAWRHALGNRKSCCAWYIYVPPNFHVARATS